MKNSFKILLEILIIAAVCGAAFLANRLLPFFPANISALIILFLLLQFKIVKRQWLASVSRFALSHFTLLFIPGAVGILVTYEYISNIAWQFPLVIVISSVLVFLAAGFTAVFAGRLKKSRKGEK